MIKKYSKMKTTDEAEIDMEVEINRYKDLMCVTIFLGVGNITESVSFKFLPFTYKFHDSLCPHR